MSKISDEELTMLYYGEHEDPDLAARVAQSKELSARFAALSEAMELVDSYQAPDRGEDYGAEVWQRIAPHLGHSGNGPESASEPWWAVLTRPRVSLAGIFSLAMVAVLAFMLGRNGNIPIQPGNPVEFPPAFTGINSERLLDTRVAGHLGRLNVGLTEFAHSQNPSTGEADWAMDMLVANRLYRQTATAGGNRRLASFLEGLEPLLIELAYEAHLDSVTTRRRMQEEVREDLLFKIRVMNKQLKTKEIST